MEKIFIILKKIIPKKIFIAFQPVYHYLLNWFSALVYSFPSNKLIVVGITGTTGKTTSVYLMAKTLEEAGVKVGYTSTAMFNDGQKEWLNDKKMTMIGRFFTQRILSKMVKNKCQVAIVETTSEGIRQFRHKFINYDICLVTGLYPEHIESHGSFQSYKEAKGDLFKHLGTCKPKYVNEDLEIVRTDSGIKKTELKRIKKTIIANLDDEHAEYFLNFIAEKKIAYTEDSNESRNKAENIKDLEIIEYSDVESCNDRVCFVVDSQKLALKILGGFNVKNAMNAYVLGYVLELDKQKIISGLERIDGVAGRIEKIDEGQNFTVIVDYAFEPNAVTKLYDAVKAIPHNNIIHVLGSAGGGRDESRRPILGRIAGENSSYVIVTNEDPYDDDPEIIMDQVVLGAQKAEKKLNSNLFKILDRREAIKKAFLLAKENDIVLITGKGSEQAIVVKNGEKISWDDRAVARGLLSELKTVDNKKQKNKEI